MKKDYRNTVTVLLAYAHRYLYLPLIIFVSYLAGKDAMLLYMGIGALLFAVYSFIGFKWRWKHIFCSFQNTYHQKMTPNHIDWDSIKKTDGYGVPIIFGILGLALILCHLFCS